jgi:EXLDI family protein
MAQKMIYVKDEDQELFNRAAEIGGDSLSAVIAEALERFVAAKEAEAAGFSEIAVKVGRETKQADERRTIRFVGREIAWQRVLSGSTNSRDDRGTTFRLFQTQKGKFLLHVVRWSSWQGEDGVSWYKIFGSLAEIRAQDQVYDPDADEVATIPGSLLDEAEETLGQEVGEFLDI